MRKKMDKTLIELKNVTFTYLHKEKPSIKGVNLKLDRGEMVALIGPLGSGKSTLLRLLNGIAPHQFPGKLEGDVLVKGLNTREHEPVELSQHVGLVLDDPRTQIFNLTVEDDVAFGPINLGLPREEVEERVRYAIDALRLKGLEKKHPRELSGGQQQRVALAGVLAMRPDVMALDEPISMLDPIGKSEVLSAIKDLNKKHNITCIIAESGADLEDVVSFATRAIVIKEGKILLDDSPSKVLENRLLEELGVGLPQIVDLILRLDSKLKLNLPSPTTVEGATEIIMELLKKKKISFKREMGQRKVEKRAPKKEGERGGDTILVAQDVWFTYPDGTQAVKGVSLKMRRGEMIALIGQNGSGKSTLALTLVGAFKPTNPEARIYLDGIDVVKTDVIKLNQRINYVFQNPDIQLFNPIVRDEVEFALKMLEESPEEIKKKVSEALKLLGLQGEEDKPIVDLTVDLKTLVAIASVLVLKPKILIIDEPTSGLDRKSSVKLMQILRGLRDEGHTIVIITHNMKLAYEFCDRVIVMNDGRIILDGTPSQVYSNVEILKQAYMKSPQVTQLAYNLSDYKVPLDICTVEEFLDMINLKGVK
jgi:energy-coupling factor transport system ATP-binding protein